MPNSKSGTNNVITERNLRKIFNNNSMNKNNNIINNKNTNVTVSGKKQDNTDYSC